jgi:hypothetical protein
LFPNASSDGLLSFDGTAQYGGLVERDMQDCCHASSVSSEHRRDLSSIASRVEKAISTLASDISDFSKTRGSSDIASIILSNDPGGLSVDIS